MMALDGRFYVQIVCRWCFTNLDKGISAHECRETNMLAPEAFRFPFVVQVVLARYA